MDENLKTRFEKEIPGLISLSKESSQCFLIGRLSKVFKALGSSEIQGLLEGFF